MSETPEIINEEPIIEESINTTSEEEKFFGKQVEIDSKVDDGLSVEIVDDTPEEDRRPPKVEPEEPADDETVDAEITVYSKSCLLYKSPSPRDKRQSRMPSSA